MTNNEFNELLDKNAESILTPFQRAIAYDIFYCTKIYGKYKIIKSHINKKYASVLDEETRFKEIDNLIESGYLKSTKKPRIFNGKYITETSLEFTNKFKELLKDSSKEPEKVVKTEQEIAIEREKNIKKEECEWYLQKAIEAEDYEIAAKLRDYMKEKYDSQ